MLILDTLNGRVSLDGIVLSFFFFSFMCAFLLELFTLNLIDELPIIDEHNCVKICSKKFGYIMCQLYDIYGKHVFFFLSL